MRLQAHGESSPPPSSAVAADGPGEPGAAPRYRSKTVATWIAFAFGTLGLHRFYLHGFRDVAGWLHPLPTAAGCVGVARMDVLGQDDRLAWLLIPLLGLMLSQAMLCAIVYALTPDERWDARRNAGRPGAPTGWGPVLGAVASLMVGGAVLMGTVAFAGQKFFEWQLGAAEAADRQNR